MKPVPKIRSAYDGSRVRVSPVFGASLTRQSEAAGTDVNRIMALFAKSGILPQQRAGEFLDVSEVGDYREAVERVRRTDEYFSQLPAQVRAKFENDPAAFLDALPNLDVKELRELGLLAEDERSEPPGAPVVPPVEPVKP